MVDIIHLIVDIIHLIADIIHLIVDIIHLIVDIIHLIVDIIHLIVDIIHLIVDIIHLIVSVIVVPSSDGSTEKKRSSRLQSLNSCNQGDSKELLAPKKVVKFYEKPMQKRAVAVNGSTTVGKFLNMVGKKLEQDGSTLSLWARKNAMGPAADWKGFIYYA